jgi:glyoxylase-like metal-dependent hydrolase (beta-lactamase superfamily II)
VVSCEKTKAAIIIDPGFDSKKEAEKIFQYIETNGLHVNFIVNTHGHPDHSCGNGLAKKNTGAPILIHELDAGMLGEIGKAVARASGYRNSSPIPDILLRHGDPVEFGEEMLRVLHTPGHSPGSISLLGKNLVFTGDTLFAGSIGRTDLPGGSFRDLMRSLKERIAVLPEHFVVYPGHGPATTIGAEKRMNPFLQETMRFMEGENF